MSPWIYLWLDLINLLQFNGGKAPPAFFRSFWSQRPAPRNQLVLSVCCSLSSCLTFLVQVICVCGLVRFVADVNIQVFGLSHDFYHPGFGPWMLMDVVQGKILRKSTTILFVLLPLLRRKLYSCQWTGFIFFRHKWWCYIGGTFGSGRSLCHVSSVKCTR